MKWALIIVGTLIGVVLIIVAVGAMLPRDHVVTMTARIAAPQADVWSTITQVEGFTKWRPEVTRVEMLPATFHGGSWREHTKNGSISMAIEKPEPPNRLVTRILDGDLPYGGQWEYELAADGPNATRVTITERGWVSNPLFRFVSRFVMGHTATMDGYLRALGKHFGSEPTPTVVTSKGA